MVDPRGQLDGDYEYKFLRRPTGGSSESGFLPPTESDVRSEKVLSAIALWRDDWAPNEWQTILMFWCRSNHKARRPRGPL